MPGCGGGTQANGKYGEHEGGVYDARNGVHFPEGFEIFRNYKRREYKATARRGFWVREDTGERYSTLNRLNSRQRWGDKSDSGKPTS